MSLAARIPVPAHRSPQRERRRRFDRNEWACPAHIDFEQQWQDRAAAQLTTRFPPPVCRARLGPSPPGLNACRAVRRPPRTMRSCCSAFFDRQATARWINDPGFGIIRPVRNRITRLSPAVNDPGTAIEVANAGIALVCCLWRPLVRPPTPYLSSIGFTRRPSRFNNLISTSSNPIARDGAALVEVQFDDRGCVCAIGTKSAEICWRCGAPPMVVRSLKVPRKRWRAPGSKRLRIASRTLMDQIRPVAMSGASSAFSRNHM